MIYTRSHISAAPLGVIVKWNAPSKESLPSNKLHTSLNAVLIRNIFIFETKLEQNVAFLRWNNDYNR